MPGARRIRCIESNTFGRANVAIGDAALANNISGDFDTAIGTGALFRLNMGVGNSLDSGNGNSAFGASTLGGNLHGSNNTATGCGALNGNNGSNNTVTGAQALSVSQFGYDNTAFGYQALHNSTGDQNIAIGSGAGVALVSGTKNIYVGHRGVASESKTIRLGNVQTRTFIAGVATAAVTGTNVVINTAGQLGVPLSSARYKRDIEPMGGRSDGVLKLRPVTFVYKQDEQGVRQYGLIAEEVAAVYSELVTHTATGEVQAVRYQELIPMLVNEVQRQQHVIERLERPQHVTTCSGSWRSYAASWGRCAAASRNGRGVTARVWPNGHTCPGAITGHKTESVYRRYAIVSDADLQEAARKLAGTFPGTTSTTSLDSPCTTAQNPRRSR